MVYCSNRGGGDGGDGDADDGTLRTLGAGNYGLSNSLLDCPWRKVQRGKAEFEQVVKGVEQDKDGEKLTESLLKLLADDTWLVEWWVW